MKSFNPSGLIVFLLCISLMPFNFAQDITLVPFANGINQPLTIAHAGDERLFVLEKPGKIKIVQANGEVTVPEFLDIRSKVSTEFNEMGLLGLAFHPDYANNGYFYVNYTDDDLKTTISRFSVDPENPDLADPNSEKILLTAQQPYGNHNGGDIHFGPDGYLYIGMGDGGNGGDPGNRSQNLANLMGKMLRIDVDNGDPYAIPSDNPFINNSAAWDEIWAYGLRNPWRFSFDKLTGDLFIADVGQNDYEEIDFQPIESDGGENYGWRCFEATHPFNMSQCAGVTDVVMPIAEYFQTFANGCSVTGGYVYRGSNSAHVGKYLYGDYCSGRFWTLEKNDADEWVNIIVGNMDAGELVSFGEDVNGELYVAAIGEGRIYKVQFPIVDGIGKISEDPIQFWPNPFHNLINVKGQSNDPLKIQITDLKGAVVKNVTIMPTPTGSQIDLSSLHPGSYFLSYQLNGKTYIEKVIRLSN